MADLKEKVVEDPENGKKVRFTDNSAKAEAGDFYPEDQTPKPLILDPAGAPYSEWRELDGYEIGQNLNTDLNAIRDHRTWAMQEVLGAYLDAKETADADC